MDDELTKLIEAGPDPARAIQHLVMSRFHDITAARQLARTWQEIARALGLEKQHKSLAAAYWRVRRGVETKRLAPPKGQPRATKNQPAPAPLTEEESPSSRRGFKRLNTD